MHCPSGMAGKCSGCGGDFTTDHAMVCPRGGLLSIRHNEIPDLFGEVLTEACHGVAIDRH